MKRKMMMSDAIHDEEDNCATAGCIPVATKAHADMCVAFHERLVAKLSKVVGWLENNAAQSEKSAENNERFLSLKEAYLWDAKNYRATAADIRALLVEIEKANQ